MGFAERRALITALEQARGSRVVSYIMSDRPTWPDGAPGFSLQLTPDPQLHLVDHLRAIGKVAKLDLFLYTRGGNTDVVWPLVNLFREYCDEFSVIVPFRAHSAGTMICLGADSVIMTDCAELSPIDPTCGNQFNPSDPSNPRNRFGISVEDVASYVRLTAERIGLKAETSKVEVLRQLTQQVHPLALGNVERVYLLIRQLGERLLEMHLEKTAKIKAIVKAMTEEFYSHVHAISRKEAVDLVGEWVRAPTAAENAAILPLFESYAGTLNLRTRFSVPEFMGDNVLRELAVPGGFLEDGVVSHVHSTKLQITQRSQLPPGFQMQLGGAGQAPPIIPWAGRQYEYTVHKTGWETNDAGI